jgi:hypothetical protein
MHRPSDVKVWHMPPAAVLPIYAAGAFKLSLVLSRCWRMTRHIYRFLPISAVSRLIPWFWPPVYKSIQCVYIFVNARSAFALSVFVFMLLCSKQKRNFINERNRHNTYHYCVSLLSYRLENKRVIFF